MTYQYQITAMNRWINRRSNTVVEKINSLLLRLAAIAKRLDEEQDKANTAMKQELLDIEARIDKQIAAFELQKTNTQSKYLKIINESKKDAEAARKLEANFRKLTE